MNPKKIITYYIVMSKLIQFYSENGKTTTNSGIYLRSKLLTQEQCSKYNVYISPSYIGYAFDLGIPTIGKRPVHRSYEVGDFSKSTPTQYKDPATYDCKQPCWDKVCK